MLRRGIPLALLIALGGALGCASTSTQVGSVSESDLQAEQLKQQVLVLESQLTLQSRVDDIAWPLLTNSVPLCGNDVRFRTGYRVENIAAFDKQWVPAARAAGFNDTLRVVGVSRGSPADSAGLRRGDRLVAIAGSPLPLGSDAMKEFARRSGDVPQREGATVAVRVVRDYAAVPLSLSIPVQRVCSYNVVAVSDEVLNAWSDGESVFITSGIARFASADSELAVVLGHELAHNAMHHMGAKKRNAGIGAILGAALDVAAASQGVNTQGGFSSAGANAGSQVFSQDFEREADYVGMYFLARANLPYDNAANFWRRMAQASPGSIKYASTHPTTAERFIRLDQAAKEIDGKRAAKQELVPNKK